MKKVIKKKKPVSLGVRGNPRLATIKNWEHANAGELLNNPPVSFQPECLTEPWCGVAVPWLNLVEARFHHQELRAAAMAMLEKQSAALKGESFKPHTWTDVGGDVEAVIKPMDYQPTPCVHERRVAELVQMCAECNVVLKHDERVMIDPARYESLLSMEQNWHKLGAYIRMNYQTQIERGEHAGVSDADVVIGYLSRGRAGA